MEKPEPIKRDKALEPLSHDHHHGLMFCWKIKQGLKKGVSAERIMAYARHFFVEQLEEHFREEEQFLFPLLGMENELVIQAVDEHKELRALFFDEKNKGKACEVIAKKLKDHIRFEERVLFNEIQKKAGKEELQKMNQQLHSRPAELALKTREDTFWES